MKLVIDTNVIIASLSSKSKYHWIIQWLREGKFQLAVTTEIFLEYEEKLKEKYNPIVASSFLNALKELPNVNYVEVYTNWGLIQEDLDDNKFVDCTIASNANFIITNDRHFNILKTIGFPKLNVMSIEEFKQFCEGNISD